MAENTGTQVKTVSGDAAKVTSVVAVACKLPHGLILRLYDMMPTPEPVLGGGTREVMRASQKSLGDLREVKLTGYVAPNGKDPKVRTFMGYAINEGVPKEFFEEWMKQNKDHDAVKNKLIFSMPDIRQAEQRVKNEFEKHRSGFEPLDPKKPMAGIRQANLTGSDPEYQGA